MLRVSTIAANSMVNTLASLMDGGRLCIYAGTPPSAPDDSTTEKSLVEIPLPSIAFKESAERVAQSFPVQKGVPALRGGNMAWFRGVTADGTAIVQGRVGSLESDAELRVPALGLSPGVLVDLDGWELRLPL